MKKKQPAFLLPMDQKEIIDELDNEEAGIIFKAIYEYEVNKTEPKLNKMMKIIFKQFKVKLDNYDNAYEEKCLKNKENITRYWEEKKNSSNEYERIRSNTNVYKIKENKNKENKIKINKNESKENNIKEYIKDNIKEIKEDNKNKSERKKESMRGNIVATATTPTLELISSYGADLGIDKNYCERFFNHYESIGWVTGTGQKIKNWKLIFKNWVMKDNINVKEKSEFKKVGRNGFKL
jgi:hypothetical protein